MHSLYDELFDNWNVRIAYGLDSLISDSYGAATVLSRLPTLFFLLRQHFSNFICKTHADGIHELAAAPRVICTKPAPAAPASSPHFPGKRVHTCTGVDT
eukprot:gene5478-7178_t